VFILPPLLRFADWAFAVHKLLVMASWAAAFSLASAVARRRTARLVLTAALLIAWAGAVTIMARRPATTSAAARSDGRRIDSILSLERYATVDMSWRTLLDVGRPVVSDRAFLSTLREAGDVTTNRQLP